MPDVKERLNGLCDDMKRKILDLCCSLSPENLSCDGECSPFQIHLRRNEIMKEWHEIERIVGFTFSEMDVPEVEWFDELNIKNATQWENNVADYTVAGKKIVTVRKRG
jgi:hypothetical protein